MLTAALLATACHEFPCDGPVELKPEPIPIAGQVKFTFFTTAGAQTTSDPELIPYRSGSAVLVQMPDADLPIGVVLAADLTEGVPESAIPTTHGIAARSAYTGLVGGWVGDRVWGHAQEIAEDIDASVPTESEEVVAQKSPLSDIDLDDLDRKRRKRWSKALMPRLVDVGLVKPPRDVWFFDREGCYAENMSEDARGFDVEKLDDAKVILRRLAGWSGVEPTVPAVWRP